MQNFIFSTLWKQSRILTLDEAHIFSGLTRPSKPIRMLRALWRVKDA